jgi:hypothetical protein
MTIETKVTRARFLAGTDGGVVATLCRETFDAQGRPRGVVIEHAMRRFPALDTLACGAVGASFDFEAREYRVLCRKWWFWREWKPVGEALAAKVMHALYVSFGSHAKAQARCLHDLKQQFGAVQ